MRLHNFCAGPATLPTSVLAQVQADLLDWHGMGTSVMEISHRSAEFVSVAEQAEQDLRDLMEIPDNYQVLFLQGGASLQFSAVPLNLCHTKQQVDYLDTGVWSAKAIAEAKRYANVNVVASSQEQGYNTVPDTSLWKLGNPDQTAYLHYCPNETINGVALLTPPQLDVPIVADMSSCILSQPINVADFGVIYAGAQKNIGPAGLTIVIVREDLLAEPMPYCPKILSYQQQANANSMVNTPPTFAWYLAGLVFKWLKEQGGVSAMAVRNGAKAKTLYDYIDSSEFYHNSVDTEYRSIMNIPFQLSDDQYSEQFLSQAAKAGLLNLKGHRSVGGMRASLYNAVTQEAVDALVDFMQQFEQAIKTQ